MKIGIVGAGLTGLSAAYKLSKNGHKITVFETEVKAGGLAVGFDEKNWEWSLEKYYHHFFINDKFILQLAKEINHKVIIKRSKTSTLINGTISQLDSPIALMKFPFLTFAQRLRMGISLALLRYDPIWRLFDRFRAIEVLSKMMGKKGFEMIWEPLFKAKFGKYVNEISLAWFWARIRKRTSFLAYPEGGFLMFAENLCQKIRDNGGKFYFNSKIVKINSKEKATLEIIGKGGKKSTFKFDKIIVTVPSFIFLKITPSLPLNYKKKLGRLKSLGSTSLILRLKKTFLEDGTYWLNVCEKESPLMAVVEHTNFMDKSYYNNEHLIYIGHYLSEDHPYFTKTKNDLLKKFDPYLKKINKNYRKNLIGMEFFKTPFAQPIMSVGYGKKIPPFETPLKNVYLANIDHVFPWDRGTNYAIELGQKIAKRIESS